MKLIKTDKQIRNPPISVAELAKHLELGEEVDLELSEIEFLKRNINTAVTHLEHVTGRNIFTTVYEYETDRYNHIVLNDVPFNSIVVKANNIDVTHNFEVIDNLFNIEVKTGIAVYEKVVITYTSGDAGDTPPDLKAACIIFAASLYDENRNTAIVGVSKTDTGIVNRLVLPYIIKRY